MVIIIFLILKPKNNYVLQLGSIYEVLHAREETLIINPLLALFSHHPKKVLLVILHLIHDTETSSLSIFLSHDKEKEEERLLHLMVLSRHR